ncbi:MAG: FAD-binding oxidoreductase, partial [Chloroflexota bacterium]
MRRWNGWGEETTTYPLPDSAAHYLTTLVGEGLSLPDVSFTETVATVPQPRLPSHPLITTDPAELLLHAHGQSLPDWIALRSGR